MAIERNRLYLATIADDAARMAGIHGLGLELDEFCTAINMDSDFEIWDARVKGALKQSERLILHAPFSELSPCAIDPMVKQVTRFRLDQALKLCERYGVRRMVVHTGFIPRTYFPVWFVEQASVFFREFLTNCPPDFQLLIENVLDPDPAPIRDMVLAVGDPRAGICFDAGHANVASEIPVAQWLDELAPLIRHFHLHDNNGSADEHRIPGDGSIGYPALFDHIHAACPDATITFECPDATRCVAQLQRFGLI